MSTPFISIAIADDHPITVDGLKLMLSNQKDMRLVATYPDGNRLLEGLEQQTPDILLLDIKMPGIPGEEVAKLIAKKFPDIRIIALSYLDSVYYVRTMMKSGVSGYLSKNCSNETLIRAIRQVYNGEQYVEDFLKEKILQSALSNKKENRDHVRLTRREKDVLQLLASNFNSQQIADRLFLSKRTVENHRFSLLIKLGVKNSAALVKRAIEMNLL